MFAHRRSSPPPARPEPPLAGLAGLVGLAVLVAGVRPPARVAAQQGGPDLAEAAARFERECASCHVAPDPGVATDLAWIRQLQETAWSDLPAGARAALQQLFGTPRPGAPRAVAPAPPARGEGAVEVRAPRPGEALLRDDAGVVRRLTWAATPGGRFALPAGRHVWLGYRLVEGPWHLSVTGELRALAVAPGTPAPVLEVPDRIALTLRGAPAAAGVHAEVGLAGADGAGLSLYRDGRRVALACALLDAGGAPVGGAQLRYG